jgi:DNA-binding response OmpR family regulator
MPEVLTAFIIQKANQSWFLSGKSRHPGGYKIKGIPVINQRGKNQDMSEHQRIMVIDNDQDMLKFLDSMLEQEGFDTVVMAEADTAPELLDNMGPDLIILELSASDDENIETLDLMRKYSDVPIIVLSADVNTESVQRALSHGADDYIRMPFGVKPFMARIRAKLRRSHENILQ